MPTTRTGEPQAQQHGRAATAQFSTFSLLGTSPTSRRAAAASRLPNPDLRAVGVNTFLVRRPAAARAGNDLLWEFAFNTWERKASPVGTFLEVDLDMNNDGIIDYIVLNRDVSGLTSLTDGRQVTAVLRLNATGASPVDVDLLLRGERDQHGQHRLARLRAATWVSASADIGRPMTADFFASPGTSAARRNDSSARTRSRPVAKSSRAARAARRALRPVRRRS